MLASLSPFHKEMIFPALDTSSHTETIRTTARLEKRDTMYSKDEEHFLLQDGNNGTRKKRMVSLISSQTWAWCRVVCLALISHACFFGLGFVVSRTLQRVGETTTLSKPTSDRHSHHHGSL